MSDRKIRKQHAALSRRRVALGLIAALIVAAVPTMSHGEEEIYRGYRRRGRRRRRRRRCSYHVRRC